MFARAYLFRIKMEYGRKQDTSLTYAPSYCYSLFYRPFYPDFYCLMLVQFANDYNFCVDFGRLEDPNQFFTLHTVSRMLSCNEEIKHLTSL